MNTEEKQVDEQSQSKIEEYIQQVKDLKENTVSKEEFSKVVAERDKLAEAILNDRGQPKEEGPKKSIAELAKDCQEKNLTNIEAAKRALSYRKAVLDETGHDVFLPNSKEYSSSDKDKEEANKVAETLETLIKESNGSNIVFTAMLQDTLVEPQSVTALLKKRDSAKNK